MHTLPLCHAQVEVDAARRSDLLERLRARDIPVKEVDGGRNE